MQDARDWVEYCNGNTSTIWGALRAARGHPEPYNVKIWYLGNEIGWHVPFAWVPQRCGFERHTLSSACNICRQARFPNYPNSTASTGAASGAEYAKILEALIPPLLAVDPSLTLIAVEVDPDWNAAWINSTVVKSISAVSAHIGYADSDAGGSPGSVVSATAQAKLPQTAVLSALAAVRRDLDAMGSAAHVRISIDEWGLGAPWVVENFNTAHAIYGASFLTMLLNNALQYGVSFSNYFEPINEGAVQVRQFTSVATPLGVVLPLFGALAGSARLVVTQASVGIDDDVIGVAALASSGGRKTITLVLTNLNAGCDWTQRVQFAGAQVSSSAVVRLLTADGYTTNSTFALSSFTVTVSEGGWADVPLPRFSVASVAVSCISC